MSRVTQKGQVTIPKEIREMFDIKPNDIGEFSVRDGSVIFTVKKGTILDAHIRKTEKSIDFGKVRKLMEEEIAKNVVKEIK